MAFVVTRERLVSLRVDAVVNPASPSLAAMDGVSAEIFNAAGQRRLGAACRRIGYCETGRAVLTRGYGLRAKYIIHTVGPIWRSGDEIEPLASAYRSALDLAMERDCGSVAIPLLSVGKYGCPSEVSLKIARRVICTFLEEHDLAILLVLPEESGPVLEDELFRAVQSYVDEHFRPGGAPFCAYAPYWVKREMSRCLAGISIDADCDRLDEPLPGTDTPMVELLPGTEGPDVGVVDDMTAQDCAAILWDAVRKLPAGPRAAVILRYRDGLGAAAAGSVIGADQAQIRKWLRQGLRDLRRPDVRDRLLPFWKI